MGESLRCSPLGRIPSIHTFGGAMVLVSDRVEPSSLPRDLGDGLVLRAADWMMAPS